MPEYPKEKIEELVKYHEQCEALRREKTRIENAIEKLTLSKGTSERDVRAWQKEFRRVDKMYEQAAVKLWDGIEYLTIKYPATGADGKTVDKTQQELDIRDKLRSEASEARINNLARSERSTTDSHITTHVRKGSRPFNNRGPNHRPRGGNGDGRNDPNRRNNRPRGWRAELTDEDVPNASAAGLDAANVGITLASMDGSSDPLPDQTPARPRAENHPTKS